MFNDKDATEPPLPFITEPPVVRSFRGLPLAHRPLSLRGCAEPVNSPNASSKLAAKLVNAVLQSQTAQIQHLLQMGASPDSTDEMGTTALWVAAYAGHAGLVDLLLKAHASTELADEHGVTPLAVASQEGHLGTVEALLAGNADPGRCDDRGEAPLLFAGDAGHDEAVRALLRAKAAPDAQSHQGETALLAAASRGNNTVVMTLIEARASLGPDFKAVQTVENNMSVQQDGAFTGVSHGLTALLVASRQGHSGTVALLLEAGSVMVADIDGRTPLWMAAHCGHAKLVRQLLLAEAAPDLRDAGGVTPLIAAAQNDHEAAVAALLDGSACTNLTGKDGRTALWIATCQGYPAVIAALLDGNADPDVCDELRHSPLYLATLQNHLPAVYMLLQARASPDLRDKSGTTPLYLTALQGSEAIAMLLLQHAASPSLCRHADGSSPLWTAVRQQSYACEGVVKTLLKAHADPNVTDNDGDAPLFVLAFQGRDGMVRLLLAARGSPTQARHDGATPLHLASAQGHHLCADILLQARAEVNAVMKSGSQHTPLTIAAHQGQMSTYWLLLQHGADMSYRALPSYREPFVTDGGTAEEILEREHPGTLELVPHAHGQLGGSAGMLLVPTANRTCAEVVCVVC